MLYFQSSTNNQIFEIQGRISFYVTFHSAILLVGHLSSIINGICQLTGVIKLHRTKCTYIINDVLRFHFNETLKLDNNKAKFSLLIVESTDITDLKLLGVSIIFFFAK